MEKLTTYSLFDVIGELFSEEISFAVTNTKEYIFYRSSKRINLKIAPGDPVKEGTITYKALHTGEKASEFISRDVLGVPYHGIAVPFHEDGEIAGCITAIYPALTEARSVVTLKTQDGWVPVTYEDIYYIESKNRRTYVTSSTQTGTNKNTLQEFEFTLPKDSFIRCHRSYIVNVKQIKEIYLDTHSTFVLSMKNGQLIPVSQSYSSYFRRMLGF
ncbi:LytR family transcriptional regulator [Bacillus sp. FJAT-27916]|uniref:LytTR family DNA-binding domain-containing protein n=1 Tax=Bacillus sp. FJAT-27916 TaxID=1679169 RepID=UPI000670981A|nr:LytTR family DNA-binding domain-containing protein [Bacillus sp. FJAT-27916]KMY45823.1 LytR family transcriptional regulator [Bacillus sp. FJAT-27916]